MPRSNNLREYNPDAYRLYEQHNKHGDSIVNCYAYSLLDGKPIAEVRLDDVEAILEDKNHFVWLGLHNPSVETVRHVQQAFGLHNLAIEDALSDHQRAKVEIFDNDIIFSVVQTAELVENDINYGTTAIFVGKNYIVSFRRGASISYEPVREYCHKRPTKLKMGPIFVFHAILDFVVDNYTPITTALDEYLKEQERNIFSGEFSLATLHSLYELKGQLVHMRAMLMPMQDICNFFINHKKNELVSFFPNEVRPYFRDINDHVLRTIDEVNGINEMLSVAMDTYLAVVNMGQNDVVRQLAAWAGIIAVPTALAGIYGMNFAVMPELDYPYAYYIVWAVMILTCTLLYLQFKRLRWL